MAKRLTFEHVEASPAAVALHDAIRQAMITYLEQPGTTPSEGVAVLADVLRQIVKPGGRLVPGLFVAAITNLTGSAPGQVLLSCTDPDCEVCGGKGTVH